jgi:hypothetical protein
MRRVVLLAITVATIGSLAGVTTVGAQTSSPPCVITVDVELSPGISAAPSTGTLTSNGQTGTIDCDGPAGRYGISAKYGTDHPVSCSTMGGGEGTQSFTNSRGTYSEEMTFEVTKVDDGVASGTFEGEQFSGVFEATATEGDCVSEPVTRARVNMRLSTPS